MKKLSQSWERAGKESYAFKHSSTSVLTSIPVITATCWLSPTLNRNIPRIPHHSSAHWLLGGQFLFFCLRRGFCLILPETNTELWTDLRPGPTLSLLPCKSQQEFVASLQQASNSRGRLWSWEYHSPWNIPALSVLSGMNIYSIF